MIFRLISYLISINSSFNSWRFNYNYLYIQHRPFGINNTSLMTQERTRSCGPGSVWNRLMEKIVQYIIQSNRLAFSISIFLSASYYFSSHLYLIFSSRVLFLSVPQISYPNNSSHLLPIYGCTLPITKNSSMKIFK